MHTINVVVTGDVDSGKSTLIGRLLFETGSLKQGTLESAQKECGFSEKDFEFACLLDSFEEERRDQMTLDTTEVFCNAGKGKRIVFIDVPGHRELLGNMVSGSSYADIAVLVIDAFTSLKEQTQRHAFILEFLRVRRIIAVLNKMDTVGFSEPVYTEVVRIVKEMADKIDARVEAVIPVSAKHGDNLIKRSSRINWYKGRPLFSLLLGERQTREDQGFCFAVQEIYPFGEEKMANGIILSGAVRPGAGVKILPEGCLNTLTSIQTMDGPVRQACFPSCPALMFKDMSFLKRGQIVVLEDCSLNGTSEFQAKIVFMRDYSGAQDDYRITVFNQTVKAGIYALYGRWDTGNLEFSGRSENNSFSAYEAAEVLIKTDTPIFLDRSAGGGRFARFILKKGEDIYAVGMLS